MALWFIFCKTELLLKRLPDGMFTIPEGEQPPIELKPWQTVHNITPMEDGTEVKAVLVDSPVTTLPDHEMCGLRASYYKLPFDLYMKAGKCQQILYWDSTTKFCGVCGGPMKLHTDISKRCTMCGKEVWPVPSTAVITLIHRGDEVLLIRANNFRSKFYGLVAGFVETGETLEEAARREIREEVGLEVGELKYISSQPWPYPSGLMVGFMAEYKSGDVHLQRSEIAEGGWFHKDNLPTIPEPLSIARKLIDLWLGKQVEIK